MTRGLTWSDTIPATPIDIIIVSHVHVSIVANTRPRNSSETWRRSWEKFSTELTATAARETAIQTSAIPNVGARLKST